MRDWKEQLRVAHFQSKRDTALPINVADPEWQLLS